MMSARIAIFGLACSLCSAFSQTSASVIPPKDAPDPALYQEFFRQVSILKALSNEGTETATIIGVVSRLTIPRVQDVIGLTDAEVEVLNSTVAEFNAKSRSLEKATSPLIFESRLESVDSGKVSEATARKLLDLDGQRNRMTLDQVNHLREALSDSAFQKLDAYVRAPSEAKKSLLPQPTRNSTDGKK